jgi:hypothetical protein
MENTAVNCASSATNKNRSDTRVGKNYETVTNNTNELTVAPRHERCPTHNFVNGNTKYHHEMHRTAIEQSLEPSLRTLCNNQTINRKKQHGRANLVLFVMYE